MTTFSDLPGEVLLKIVDSFGKLDLHTCTLVNKQMYIAVNHLLWQHRKLVPGDTIETIQDEAAAVHCDSCDCIHALKLHSDYWTDVRVFALVDSFKMHQIEQLEELHLIFTWNVTNTGLKYIVRRCPQLKALYLCQVPRISTRSIKEVARNCPQLAKLNVEQCYRLGVKVYAALESCPLNVMTIADPPLALQSETGIRDLMWHCPQLTELKISLSRRQSSRFIAQLLSAATGAWPELHQLALTNYVSPVAPNNNTNNNNDHVEHDEPLILFLRHHAGIQHLYLRQCHLSGYTLDAMAALALPQLKTLTLTDSRNVKPHAIRQLVKVCPQLVYVCCSACNVDFDEFPELGIKLADLNPCPGDFRRWNCDCMRHLHHLDHEDIIKIRLAGHSGGRVWGHADRWVFSPFHHIRDG